MWQTFEVFCSVSKSIRIGTGIIMVLVFLVTQTVGVSQNGLDTLCRRWHLFRFCLEFSFTTTNTTIDIVYYPRVAIYIYWYIGSYSQKFLLKNISKLFVCRLEFSLSTETFYALFSDELSCFSEEVHTTESFNDMFRNVWGFSWIVVNFCECLKFFIYKYELWWFFVNVWGGRFWWPTGCAVRGKTTEKEARTRHWKDTGGMIQLFKYFFFQFYL